MNVQDWNLDSSFKIKKVKGNFCFVLFCFVSTADLLKHWPQKGKENKIISAVADLFNNRCVNSVRNVFFLEHLTDKSAKTVRG